MIGVDLSRGFARGFKVCFGFALDLKNALHKPYCVTIFTI